MFFLCCLVPVYYEQGVVGDRVHLPCDISIAEGPHQAEDSVVLVLWYREDLGTPIYRYLVIFFYSNFEIYKHKSVIDPVKHWMTFTILITKLWII